MAKANDLCRTWVKTVFYVAGGSRFREFEYDNASAHDKG